MARCAEAPKPNNAHFVPVLHPSHPETAKTNFQPHTKEGQRADRRARRERGKTKSARAIAYSAYPPFTV